MNFRLLEKKIHLKGTVTTAERSPTTAEISRKIWVNGVEILPEMAFVLRPFYECNFEWGKSGQNASYTTALSMCLAIFNSERIAENLFICFKDEFVQDFPDGDFDFDIDVTKFLMKYKYRLHPDLYSRFCLSAITSSREILLYKDPLSGLITANLADNYAMHHASIPNVKVRELNERKQRLLFRLFAKENYIISGFEFPEVMAKVENMMTKFYWRSIEKIITKQFADKYEK